MIQKHLDIHCDECASSLPLYATTIKDGEPEAFNKGWSKDKDKRHLCPHCSLKQARDELVAFVKPRDNS